MNEPASYRYIYGPVSSWRLGRSLGVDPVYTGSGKTCSFDCIYCQAGPTRVLTDARKIFVPTPEILKEIKSLPPVAIDYITFSGAGEPTLAENLGRIIEEIRKIRKATEGSPERSRREKIAVLTNSSTIDKRDVREDLALADFVVAKLDAYEEKLFDKINKPAASIKFSEIIKGLKEFRARYKGKLALQIMFIKENKGSAKEIAALAREIGPDEVQINTPLRPCEIKPLPKKELDGIKKSFRGLNAVTVYEAERKETEPLEGGHLFRRRGKV